MRHLQHLKNTDATCAQRFANINEKQLHPEDDRLQHVKNTVTTSIYNNCNVKKVQNRRQILRIRRALAMGGAMACCWRAPRPTLPPWDAAAHRGAPTRRHGWRLRRRGSSTPPASAHSSTGAREQLLPPYGAAARGMRDCALAGRPRRLAWRWWTGARERRSEGGVWGGIPHAMLATELPRAISSGAASSDPPWSSRRSSLRPLPWARSSPASASRGRLGWMEAREIQMERVDKKTRESRRADKSGEACDAFGRPRPSISEQNN
jgi:hypothetical protein